MPEPHLKSIPSVLARFEDAGEVILDGVDKAGGALRVTVGLGLLFDAARGGVPVPAATIRMAAILVPQAAIEPDGRIESRFLANQKVRQFIVKTLGVFLGDENSRPPRPIGRSCP